MKLAIMQPYFFPYLGYFQLIHAVDAFVVYDDVNFIKSGWVNRNFILNQGAPQRITLSLDSASQNKYINQITTTGREKKLLRSIQQNYAKAPQFADAYPLVEAILLQPERNLARFLDTGLRKICDHLHLPRVWHTSSSLVKNNNLRGQEKILSICKELGATHYINLPGGKALYEAERFAREDIKLSFINPRPVHYKQFCPEFIPNLSIIDLIMFNDQDACSRLLQEYDIV